MGGPKHGGLPTWWWLDSMRRTERRDFLGCPYFAILCPRHPTHACRTRRPVRVNGYAPMHDTDVAHRVRGRRGDMRCCRLGVQRCGQHRHRRSQHGIRGCAGLAAEERWTPPSRTGAGDRIDAFVVRVAAMAPHVLPAHARVTQTLQRHPQVTIFDRGVRGRYPTTPTPGWHTRGSRDGLTGDGAARTSERQDCSSACPRACP